MKLLSLLIALALAGCNSTTTTHAPDAGVDPDAAPPPAPSGLELTGGGRMTGGGLVVDVQLTPIHP